MHRSFSFCLIVAAAALGTPAAAELGAPATLPLLSLEGGILAQPRESTVEVVALAGATEGLGSGVVIGRDGDGVLVLTAKHVAVYGVPSVRLGGGAALLPASIVALVPQRDLAVLEVRVPDDVAWQIPAPRIGLPPAPGQPLYVIGDGEHGTILEHASLRSVGPMLEDGPARGRFTFACGTCHPGESGAGVFRSDGTLVGIYIGRFRSVPDGAFLSSVADLPITLSDVLPRTGALF